MSKKILIADDEEEIIDLLKTTLEPAGYSLVCSTTGEIIPKLIKQEKPDLVILDVLLPGLDGYSLQIQLSQDEDTKNLPVIVLTALPAAKILFDKFPQVKLFLNKPFETKEVLEKVKELIGEP